MTKKTNHTPGPWRTYRNPHNGTFLLAGGDESKKQCYAILHSADSTSPEYMNNPTEANARLIAAAPELLSELKEADEEICHLCKRLNPQHKNCTICDDRQDRLKTIAKAEGKDNG